MTHRVDMSLMLVDGEALLAANVFAGAFANARWLALRLYDERHEDAWLALVVALRMASALAEIAHCTRCAVEAVGLAGGVDAGGEVGT